MATDFEPDIPVDPPGFQVQNLDAVRSGDLLFFASYDVGGWFIRLKDWFRCPYVHVGMAFRLDGPTVTPAGTLAPGLYCVDTSRDRDADQDGIRITRLEEKLLQHPRRVVCRRLLPPFRRPDNLWRMLRQVIEIDGLRRYDVDAIVRQALFLPRDPGRNRRYYCSELIALLLRSCLNSGRLPVLDAVEAAAYGDTPAALYRAPLYEAGTTFPVYA